jgi:hypothetical protein
MPKSAQSKSDDQLVTAQLSYAIDTGEVLINQITKIGDTSRKITGEYCAYDVTMHDGRVACDAFSIETHGFIFVNHPSAVTDFYDDTEVTNVYYPEAERLLLAMTGSARVHIFDHTRRHSHEPSRTGNVREPATSVHNDYTEWSGPRRLRDILPDEAEGLLQRRFAIIQIWRAINLPIEVMPLAMCDARTLDPADLLISERRSPGRIGQTYQVKYNPSHKWYWFSKMTRNEALIFKVYDSNKNSPVRWTAHSAFENKTARDDAPPRESMEIRAFVFW